MGMHLERKALYMCIDAHTGGNLQALRATLITRVDNLLSGTSYDHCYSVCKRDWRTACALSSSAAANPDINCKLLVVAADF